MGTGCDDEIVFPAKIGSSGPPLLAVVTPLSDLTINEVRHSFIHQGPGQLHRTEWVLDGLETTTNWVLPSLAATLGGLVSFSGTQFPHLESEDSST